MAQLTGSTPMPKTGNVRQMGEGEENRATRPVVIVNFQQVLSQVEATTQNIYTCINAHGALLLKIPKTDEKIAVTSTMHFSYRNAIKVR